jgi:hypothetical protein
MRVREIITRTSEAKPDKDYCQNTPTFKMSNSWKSSCKSQGHIARTTVDSRAKGKSHKIGTKRVHVKGKKIKGKKYGGPLPDWS